MKTNSRIKSKIVKVPDRAVVETLVRLVAKHTAKINQIKAQMDEEILAIKKRYESSIVLHQENIKQDSKEVKAWALANPGEFETRKSVEFGCGKIGFRTGQPKLALLRGWKTEDALYKVMSLLPNFIRSKPEIDQQALIGQREELAEFLPMCGLKVVQDEGFYIEPDLTKVENRISESATKELQ